MGPAGAADGDDDEELAMAGRSNGTDRDRTIEEIEAQRDLDIDRDGVSSLHDVEAEAGDEEGLRDRYRIDHAEAQALGVALDPIGATEPDLD